MKEWEKIVKSGIKWKNPDAEYQMGKLYHCTTVDKNNNDYWLFIMENKNKKRLLLFPLDRAKVKELIEHLKEFYYNGQIRLKQLKYCDICRHCRTNGACYYCKFYDAFVTPKMNGCKKWKEVNNENSNRD